jgi:5-methylcytosine-specific restriction protein A
MSTAEKERPRFERGKRYHRQTDLHGRFGGNRQSGIAPCAKYPLILLFASPRGEEFGYRDGWTSESEYAYTGEGQSGDMEMARGNRAISQHVDAGRELHLFEKVEGGYYEYLGQFRYVGHQARQGPDADGKNRSQIVFRLELCQE